MKLSPQDPQARINLSLAMLETDAKGVREHIELVQRMRLMAPELAAELDNSIADGLARTVDWLRSTGRVVAWLEDERKTPTVPLAPRRDPVGDETSSTRAA